MFFSDEDALQHMFAADKQLQKNNKNHNFSKLSKTKGLVRVFNVLLDFLRKMWPKCRAHPHFIAPHVGHTSISYDCLLKVITFQLRL